MRLFLKSPEPEVQVWPSYTDVAMTVILILLFYLFAQATISSQTAAKMLEVQDKQHSLRKAVTDAIPPEMRESIKITDDGNLMRLTFADWILFDSGQAALKPRG